MSLEIKKKVKIVTIKRAKALQLPEDEADDDIELSDEYRAVIYKIRKVVKIY
jgi:hypothetical protein